MHLKINRKMKTKDARFGVFLYVIQLVTVVLDIAKAVRGMDDKHIVAYIKALSDELGRRQQ